jgi:hypothetical protein
MKSFIFMLLVMFSAIQTPLVATYFILGSDITDIEIAVDKPDGFREEDIEEFDLVFQHRKDVDRRIFFHFFTEPQFEANSIESVAEYAESLFEIALDG